MLSKHTAPVDVLLVNPPSPDGYIYIRDINRHGRSSWERMIWPQTNLAILAAVAESVGLSVDIVDCIAERVDWSQYEVILQSTKPKYCFSNLISVTYSNDVRALRRAKEISGAITVGMGPHITDSPGRSVSESDGLDFVIRHEPEETFKELLQVLSTEALTVERLPKIAGIAFVPARLVAGASQETVVTDKRPFIADLDSLPLARHDLLPINRYWAPFLGNYTFIETSRGCPYRCIFCRQGVMYQWKYRTRSGKSLALEALRLHDLGVGTILFHADTFTAGGAMVEELCDALIAAGAPVRWACNSHALNLHNKPELIRKMKRAGCWMIAIGIESGNDQILKNIKKQTNVRLIEDVVKEIDAAGIETWGYFVLGFPGETMETIEETIKFACKLPLKIAKFDIGAPYPGTEFYRYVTEKGYLHIDRYEDFDQNASAVVNYPDLSADDIKDGVRRAHRRFYLRPKILVRLLREALNPKVFATFVLIVRDQLRLLARKRVRVHDKASNKAALSGANAR
jgi:radical SAM superfamily enzyme YgiQ (UPF0313 family)